MLSLKELLQPGEEKNGFTSMIDVVFLLLLFFILQPFKAEEFKLEMPMDSVGDNLLPPPNPPMVVNLFIKGQGNRVTYAVESRLTDDVSRLASLIRSDTFNSGNVRVIIHADGRVRYGKVVGAVDQCYYAGVKDIAFADKRRDL